MSSTADLGLASANWYSRPAARRWRCSWPAGQAAAFHAALPGYRRTALTELPALAAELGVARVLVKDESERLGLPAFKVLGASFAIAQLVARRAGLAGQPTLTELARACAGWPLTLVTATDGNHGRAVARMASLIGLRAHIMVPLVVPEPAVAAIAAEGAVIARVDGSYDDAVQVAVDYVARQDDAVLIQDMSWAGYEDIPRWIVEGYATLPHEIDAQLTEAGLAAPSLIVVPAGVGSLAQAMVCHYRSRSDADRAPAVLSVEPDSAAGLLASLRAGQLRSVPTAVTVMAALNCGTPSTGAWPYLRDGLDAATCVSDAADTRAQADLASLGVGCGPSGAATLAGARAVLAGPGSADRRSELGVSAASLIVLVSTDGSPAPASQPTS